MVIDQQVMEELKEPVQPTISSELIDEELESLEKKIFRGDTEAVLMEQQTKLEEIYKELNRVGLEQYQGLLGQILGYLADYGVIDGRKRLKGKVKNIIRAKAGVESLIRRAQKQVINGNEEYARLNQTFNEAYRLLLGYEANRDSLKTLLDEKKESLARAQVGNPNDKSYFELPIEIGKVETDVMTVEYKMGRAASKVNSCDRRLDAIDYKRKVAMQQVGVLGNMANTLETILDIADSSFGEGINPLSTLKAVNYAANTVKELNKYVEIINDKRSEIDSAMNELPKLLEDQFDFNGYKPGEVVTIEADRTIATAKKAAERRLYRRT